MHCDQDSKHAREGGAGAHPLPVSISSPAPHVCRPSPAAHVLSVMSAIIRSVDFIVLLINAYVYCAPMMPDAPWATAVAEPNVNPPPRGCPVACSSYLRERCHPVTLLIHRSQKKMSRSGTPRQRQRTGMPYCEYHRHSLMQWLSCGYPWPHHCKQQRENGSVTRGHIYQHRIQSRRTRRFLIRPNPSMVSMLFFDTVAFCRAQACGAPVSCCCDQRRPSV